MFFIWEGFGVWDLGLYTVQGLCGLRSFGALGVKIKTFRVVGAFKDFRDFRRFRGLRGFGL